MTAAAATANDDYTIAIATTEDIPEIVALQADNQIGRGGALSIEFSPDWFARNIADMPTIVARRRGQLVGYLVSSSRSATRDQAISQAKFAAYPATESAYNSGPLCIAASERGRGLVAKLFAAQRAALPEREGVGFVRSDNLTSRAVHAKYRFSEVAEFTHRGVDYVVISTGTGDPKTI